MVFSVIAFAPGLTRAQRERAAAGAPPFTETSAPYPELLERAGWQVLGHDDVTAAFADISRRELAAFEARRDRLLVVLGESELAERLALRRAKVEGIREGWIQRHVYCVRST